jgi:anti-sigma regulatory factor (Ser/Thr protein kinase)
MAEPKFSRRWTLLGYGETQCMVDRLVFQIMSEDGYQETEIYDVALCACDIVKNAIKWGNGNAVSETFDVELNLYDDGIEIDVTDRGKKPFDIGVPISEYPANGTREEILAYFNKNHEKDSNGVALFMNSINMSQLYSYPVMENGRQVGTTVHIAYGRK